LAGTEQLRKGRRRDHAGPRGRRRRRAALPGRKPEDADERVGDLLGIGVREPDRLFLQRPARDEVGRRLLGGELAGRRLLLLELGLRELGADFRLRLDLGLLQFGPRLALLCELAGGDYSHATLAVDLNEPLRLHYAV